MTQNRNFLISREIRGCIAARKVGLEFGTQRCYSSQEYASPVVRNSTMGSSNTRGTFFDSMICIKTIGSEFKGHLFNFFSFKLQAYFF